MMMMMSLCTHEWQETLWIDFILNLEMFVRFERQR